MFRKFAGWLDELGTGKRKLVLFSIGGLLGLLVAFLTFTVASYIFALYIKVMQSLGL